MPTTNLSRLRARWAAIGAAVAVALGAGGIGLANADKGSGQRAVTTAITACRLADTRPTTQIGAKPGTFEPGETFAFGAHGNQGECTIPDDVTGLDLNVTAVDATHPTFLTVWDTGPLPNASSLNPVPDQPPTPNAVTVNLAGDGTFNVYNLQGNVHVIIDVVAIHQHHHHDDRYHTKTQSDDRYPGKTRTIVIPATAFAPSRTGPSTRYEAHHAQAYVMDDSNDLLAPLELPAGSTITGARYVYRDNAASADVSFSIIANTDGAADSFGSFLSDGDVLGWRTATRRLNEVIPLRTSLTVSVTSANWPAVDSDLAIQMVEIAYVLP